MKQLFISIATGLMSLSAFAGTQTVSGVYRDGSLFSSTPATLHLNFSGSSVTAKIVAPGASCVPSFGTGFLARHTAASDWYQLPILHSCNDPVGYGSDRSLRITKDSTGRVTNVLIRGWSGRSGWTYFSAR